VLPNFTLLSAILSIIAILTCVDSYSARPLKNYKNTKVMKKTQLNCWIPENTFQLIDSRAKRLGMRASAYGSMILNTWAESGKGVTQIEAEIEALQVAEPQRPYNKKK
jgi:hypothetical protein